MKLLLDECVDQRFRHHLPGHDVLTVGYLGWSGVKNGELLRQAADAGFECLITTDRGIPHQHNVAALPIAILCIERGSDDLDELIAISPQVLDALGRLVSKSIVQIS